MNGGMAMPAPSADVMNHLSHVSYPVTKKDLEEACEKMSDVTESDKKWFMENLPDRTFNNPEEVKQALGAAM